MAERTIQITIKASDQTGSAVGKVESAFGGLQKKLDAIGGAMMKIGGAMSLAITAPLVGIGKKSIDAASDLSESMNKVQVVFGDSAAAVIAFSDNSAIALGQSQQQTLEAAGTFGNLFTSMGLGVEPSADMATNLVQLASDLASFNNIDPTIALEKLRSGLVGEAEPLRTLGVNISEAATKAKAMELGLIDVGDIMTPAIKAQANYALIMGQTGNAQGDFARTSGGLANSTRILTSTFADTAAQLGEQLLPIALQVVQGLSGLLASFQGLSPEMQKNIVIVLGIAAAIGPLLLIVGTLITAISAIIPVVIAVAGVLTFPLIAIIAAVGLVIAALYLAWKNNWGGIRDVLTDIWENKIKPAFSAIQDWLQTNIPKAIETVKTFWETKLLPALNIVWDFIEYYIIPVFEDVWDWLQTNIPKAIETASDFWTNTLQPALNDVWNFINTNILPIFQDVGDWLQTNIPKAIETVKTFWETKLIPALNSVWEFIDTYILPIFRTVGEILNVALTLAVEAMAGLWENVLLPAFNSVWEFIQDNVISILEDLRDFLDVALTLAVEAMAGLWENVLQPAFNSVWEFIQDNVIPILEDLRDFIVEHIGPKVQWFTDSILTPLGDVLVDSVKKGLLWVNEQLEKFKGWLESIELPAWARRHSPSPFEMVFIGANEAIRLLVRDALPKLIEKIKSVEKTAWGMAEALLSTASQFGGIAGGFVPFYERDVLDPIQREIDVWQGSIDATADTLRDQFDTMAERGMDATSALENALKTMDIGQLRDLANALRSLPPDWLGGVITQRAATNLEGIIGLIHQRNILLADYAAEEERILALQRQQQDLAFLQQQLELLDLIRELQLTDPTLDPEAILGGMQLGLDAELSDMLEAMTRAMQALIAEAEAQLGIASPSKVFERLGAFIMGGLARGIGQGTSLLGAAFRGAIPQMIGQAAGSATTNNMNLVIHSNARTEDVLANFELMKALAGV